MTPYRVTKDLFDQAKENALFMHCMPAHPGEEVTEEVLNSPRSILFDQAENRLHMQKAILKQLSNNKI
jgi:ornithine carbamoyltransferase